jgi:glucokinase
LARAIEAAAVGVDVGGTKIAAGLVDLRHGRLLERDQVPTRPERGGAAVLEDCAGLARELGDGRLAVGIGLCELVDLAGRPASGDTVDWRDLDVPGAFEAPRVVLESDVRAAARAEARFGAGAGRSPFLYVVVGTGASACLVVDGEPFAGARGQAIVLGAPPVEAFASGRALEHGAPVAAAAAALGRTLAVLANALDPSLIVLGGGLGGDGRFRSLVAAELAALWAYPAEPSLEVVGSALGGDGGIVGAALSAAAPASR